VRQPAVGEEYPSAAQVMGMLFHSIFLDTKWISGQTALLPDRVQVAQDKNPSFFSFAPLRPNDIADFLSRDHLRGESLGSQVLHNQCPHLIDQILTVTWTLQFYQVAQQLNDLIRFSLDLLD
jgi:hypothetical protein